MVPASKNVRKSHVIFPDIQGLSIRGVGRRLVHRIKQLKVNWWKGDACYTDTTTTVELAEDEHDRR